jgi:hypothetical protein
MENKYLSRKFLIAVSLIILVTVLLIFKHVDEKTWSTTIAWISGSYGLSNPLSKAAGKFNGKING